MDSSRPGTVIAGTSNALLFRSTDGGETWSRLRFPAELRATLHAFAIAPGTGAYLAGLANDTHDYSGILLSDDGGQTWRRLAGLAGKDIWSIAIWHNDPKVIAAGVSDGVYLTRDGGENWARISPESNHALMPVVSLDFDPRTSEVLYAGTPHLPWKTYDGGKSWHSVRDGMADDSDVFSIHVDTGQPNQVFASACSGMYRSLNQALSWTKLIGAKDASYRTYRIAQHPTEPEILFAGTTHGLVKSVDGGTTWRRLTPYATRWIAFDASHPRRVFAATDGAGLFRSDDLGESFRPINDGFSNRRLASLAALGTTLYAASPTGSADGMIADNLTGEQRWESLSSLDPAVVRQIVKIVPVDPNRMYVLTPSSILHSSDAGRTWTTITPPAKSKLKALLAQGNLLVASETGIYYSEDGGGKWHRAQIPGDPVSIKTLVALGPASIAALGRSAIWLSSDGKEFRAAAPPATDAAIYALVATDHSGLLAATSYGLRRSEDFGQTWQAVGGGLDSSTVSAICKHPARPGVLFASRYGAIFASEDDGRTWAPITHPGDEMAVVRELFVAPGVPDRLFALTPVQGVFTLNLEP
ncbi:MAG TPA: hypothetical protein VMH81_04765 [Bryobacteraceae bacterium]|nr:hypothetical protein [Bryobacteraceae bacterium]